MAATAIVGGTCFIFATGVVAGRVSGASWRWSSVNTMTNMAVFGSLIAIFNRIVRAPAFSILFVTAMASQLVSSFAGFYMADKVVSKQPTNHYSGVIADLAVVFATAVCASFISDRFLCEW